MKIQVQSKQGTVLAERIVSEGKDSFRTLVISQGNNCVKLPLTLMRELIREFDATKKVYPNGIQ